MFDKKERKKYQRKWYLENQKQILAEKRNDYSKDKEKYLNRCKISYQKRREKILAQKEIYDEGMKAKLKELIGFKCVICGSTEKISHHEIHGIRHRQTRKYVLDHYKDFISLCSSCHVGLHRFTRRGKINTEVLTQLIQHLAKRKEA